jgi:acyl carrier protein
MGLDLVELVMAVEEEFGINISDAEAETLVTPKLLAEAVYSKLTSMNADDEWTIDAVRAHVRLIIGEQLGITEFDDKDEFIRDMGLD